MNVHHRIQANGILPDEVQPDVVNEAILNVLKDWTG
jgi:hypothetical protein